MKKWYLGMVLSTSVSLTSMTARALQTMRRCGDPRFEGSAPRIRHQLISQIDFVRKLEQA